MFQFPQEPQKECLKVLSRHGFVFAIKGNLQTGEDVLNVEVFLRVEALACSIVHVAQAT